MSLIKRKTPISVKQAAAILGMNHKTVYNRGGGTEKLTRFNQGRSVKLIRQEVEELLESQIRKGQRR